MNGMNSQPQQQQRSSLFQEEGVKLLVVGGTSPTSYGIPLVQQSYQTVAYSHEPFQMNHNPIVNPIVTPMNAGHSSVLCPPSVFPDSLLNVSSMGSQNDQFIEVDDDVIYVASVTGAKKTAATAFDGKNSSAQNPMAYLQSTSKAAQEHVQGHGLTGSSECFICNDATNRALIEDYANWLIQFPGRKDGFEMLLNALKQRMVGSQAVDLDLDVRAVRAHAENAWMRLKKESLRAAKAKGKAKDGEEKSIEVTTVTVDENMAEGTSEQIPNGQEEEVADGEERSEMDDLVALEEFLQDKGPSYWALAPSILRRPKFPTVRKGSKKSKEQSVVRVRVPPKSKSRSATPLSTVNPTTTTASRRQPCDPGIVAECLNVLPPNMVAKLNPLGRPKCTVCDKELSNHRYAYHVLEKHNIFVSGNKEVFERLNRMNSAELATIEWRCECCQNVDFNTIEDYLEHLESAQHASRVGKRGQNKTLSLKQWWAEKKNSGDD